MNSVPEAVANLVESSAPRAAEQISGMGGAVTMSLIAFTIVFLVLGGLSGVIYAIKYLAVGFDRKERETNGAH